MEECLKMKTVSFRKHAEETVMLKIDPKNLFKVLRMQSSDLRILFSIYLSFFVFPGTLRLFVCGNCNFLVYCTVLYNNLCRKKYILRDKTSGIRCLGRPSKLSRSSPSEAYLGKSVQKICSKFT